MQTLHDYLVELKILDLELARARNIANLFKVQQPDGTVLKGGDALVGGQLEIFYAIVFLPHNRVNINCCTQYGKSLTVALACVYLTCIKNRKVAVVAPTDKKTKLIMRYYIDHLGDNPLFYSQLEANTRMERLRQEGSKERIILKHGGGIYGISAQAGNANKSIESAMGEGADIVIMDEACLIPDQTEATIFRMIAGRGKHGAYVKIGNPFYSDPPFSHFKKSSVSLKYLQIFIDYKQALAEGRYDQDFIDDAREKPLFDILYECLFPAEEDIDEKGYRRLLTLEQIKNAMLENAPEELVGLFRLGADIGRGGNFNAYVGRDDEYMWLYGKNRSNDTMTNVTEVKNAEADITMIDDTGVGGGVTDRCIEESIKVRPVQSGGSASDKKIFKNLRSECFFRFKQWILQGGKLEAIDDWFVLHQIKWKVD
ncbi:MAG: hypothetical protein RBR97_17740, partial [Bacteroidales bacterium]|nr:hypothetical protein [Bacteroidales bacterium]